MQRFIEYSGYEISATVAKAWPGKPSNLWLCRFDARHPETALSHSGEFRLIAWSRTEARLETIHRAKAIIDAQFSAASLDNCVGQ